MMQIGQNLGKSLMVLRQLDQAGPLAHADIARALSVTTAAVGIHMQKLANEKLVYLSERIVSGRGRPVDLWDVEKNHNYVIGICVCAPVLYLGMADFSGKLLISEQVDLSHFSEQEDFLAAVDKFMADALAYERRNKGTIRYAFAGLPGGMEPGSARIRDAVNMPMLNGLDMEEYVYGKYEIPCLTLNACYASYFGEMQHCPRNSTIAVIEWDLGVGALFGCNEEILNFASQPGQKYRRLWDVGHLRYKAGGPECHCGRKGCLEAFAGGWAILRNLAGDYDLQSLVDNAKAGSKKVLLELGKAAECLGEVLSVVFELLGVERVVFTGPLSEVFPQVQKEFRKGLSVQIDQDELDELVIERSEDPIGRMLAGACQVAHFAFLNADGFVERILERRRETSRLYKSNSMVPLV